MPRGDGMGPANGDGGGFYIGFGSPGSMNTLPLRSDFGGGGRSKEWLYVASQLIPAAIYLIYLIATRNKKDNKKDE